MVTSVDLTGISKLVIGSAYFPYDSASHPPEEARLIVDYCKVRGLPLLFGCNANSHHNLWGSTDTNRRGEDLVDYLITTDFDILNTGKKPNFRNSVREKVIYIILCTKLGNAILKTYKLHSTEQPWKSETQIPLKGRLTNFLQPSLLRMIATAYLRRSKRRGRPTGGIGSLRSFVRKPEKGSNGPRKAIRKNYGTYPMQLGIHTGKKSGRPRVRAGPPSVQT